MPVSALLEMVRFLRADHGEDVLVSVKVASERTHQRWVT